MFVRYSDKDKNTIVAASESPQSETAWPFQGEVVESDPKYIAFLGVITGAPSTVQRIAEERYKREGVGITVEDYVIDTTRDGQALIAGAAVSAILDPAYTCNWKTAGGFVELNAPQLIVISKAVREHVQACFDRELVLLRAIEAGEYSDDMLTEGWPDSAPPDPVELQ